MEKIIDEIRKANKLFEINCELSDSTITEERKLELENKANPIVDCSCTQNNDINLFINKLNILSKQKNWNQLSMKEKEEAITGYTNDKILKKYLIYSLHKRKLNKKNIVFDNKNQKIIDIINLAHVDGKYTL